MTDFLCLPPRVSRRADGVGRRSSGVCGKKETGGQGREQQKGDDHSAHSDPAVVHEVVICPTVLTRLY